MLKDISELEYGFINLTKLSWALRTIDALPRQIWNKFPDAIIESSMTPYAMAFFTVVVFSLAPFIYEGGGVVRFIVVGVVQMLFAPCTLVASIGLFLLNGALAKADIADRLTVVRWSTNQGHKYFRVGPKRLSVWLLLFGLYFARFIAILAHLLALVALSIGGIALVPLFVAFGQVVYRTSTEKIRSVTSKTLSQDQVDDVRLPLLFLRSFGDDGIRRNQRWYERLFMLPRFEDTFVASLGGLGPVLAVGRPGEKLPKSGAARLYVNDDQWQNAVIKGCDKSLAILLIPAETEGTLWELNYILGDELREKTIILFPPESHSTRVAKFAVYQQALGVSLDIPKLWIKYLRAAYFSSPSRLLLICANPSTPSSYLAAVLLIVDNIRVKEKYSGLA